MIPFTKAQANGNDFIIFDAQNCPEAIRDPQFIGRVCDRHAGVGADGVLILSSTDGEEEDFLLDYYNADGSWETLCANGSRCAVRYYARQRDAGDTFVLRTGAGRHQAQLLPEGDVRLQILPPSHVGRTVEVSGISGRQVDSGAPHFCAQVEGLSAELILEKGPPIRHHPQFQPRGVNVNLYERVDRQTLWVRTYEKGVEAAVLSCASGSTAAAYHAAADSSMDSPMRIINPGGELLVGFDPDWQEVWVQGSALLVFDSELPDDF